jgi:hypothetical protein
MEYGLSPPGKIESRRNRKMVKKQVHTMAMAEKIATGGDWYISLWTANAKVFVQKNGGVHVVSREQCGSSWTGELPNETIGHIQSAGCLGQKEVVTAAHNACIRELLQEVNVHGKADRHMRLFTIETESRLGTLWDQEECNQFCSKEELWEAARDEEMKIPWQEATKEGPPVPEEQYQERFWQRKMDGIGVDTETRVPSHRIQANARCEKKLRGEGNSSCSEAVQDTADGSPSSR